VSGRLCVSMHGSDHQSLNPAASCLQMHGCVLHDTGYMGICEAA
jgi:hypothetical protein